MRKFIGWALQAVLWSWAALTFVLDNLDEDDNALRALQGGGVASSLASGVVSVPWLLPFALALLATLTYLYVTLRKAGPPGHPINVISKSLPTPPSGKAAECRGIVEFDVSTESGKVEIGAAERAFILKFSKADDHSIHVAKHGTNLKRLARLKTPQRDFPVHPDQIDASSDPCTLMVGDYVYAENAFGRHALIHITSIADDTRDGAEGDRSRIEYRIYADVHALPVTW